MNKLNLFFKFIAVGLALTSIGCEGFRSKPRNSLAQDILKTFGKTNSFDLNDISVGDPKVQLIDNQHLRYFGYYWSHVSENGVEFADEYADHTNLTWIAYGGGDLEHNLKKAREHNLKVVLDVSAILFPGAGKNEISRNYDQLEKSFRDFWESQIIAKDFEDLIEVVYPIDEPYLKFAKLEGNKPLADHLDQIARLVKRVTPKLVALIEHPKILKGSPPLPANYDWIGYHCYDRLNVCRSKIDIVKLNARVVAKLLPHQNILLVPETWQEPGSRTTGNELNHRLRQYYQLALAEPRIVAMVPFLWRSYGDSSGGGRGARDISEIVPTLKEIGTQIKNGTVKFPRKRSGDIEVPRTNLTEAPLTSPQPRPVLPPKVVPTPNLPPNPGPFPEPPSTVGEPEPKVESPPTPLPPTSPTPFPSSGQPCTEAQYFLQRPDVAATPPFNRTGGAREHYRRHGFAEGMCNPYLPPKRASLPAQIENSDRLPLK